MIVANLELIGCSRHVRTQNTANTERNSARAVSSIAPLIISDEFVLIPGTPEPPWLAVFVLCTPEFSSSQQPMDVLQK